MVSSLDSRRATTTTLPAEPTTTRVLRTTTATKTVHTTTRTITVPPTIPPPVDMALTLPPSRECSRSELGRDIFSSLTMALLFQHLARSRSVTCQGPKLKTPDAIRRDSNPCRPPLRPPLIDESSDAAREDSSRRPGVLSRGNARTLVPRVHARRVQARRWSHLPTDRPPTKNRENARRLETRASEDVGGNARRRRISRVARVVRHGASRAPSSLRTSPSRSGRSAAPARVRGFGSSLPAPRQRFGASLETSRRVASRRGRGSTSRWSASTPSPRSPPRLRRTPTANAARDTP